MKCLLAALAFLASAMHAMAAEDGVQAFLEGFAAKYSKAEIDFFYVAPAKQGKFSKNVWIYWMTGNTLLFVDVPAKRLEDYDDYRAKIRLSSDVVPTVEDIQGSTYLAES